MNILRHLKRRAKRCWLRYRPHALILMYHRVVEREPDPQLLAVSPQHFAEQLHIIRARYHPISLTELVHAMSARHIPQRAVVVTFDDGYADNLHNAKSLLEKNQIPATIFVTAGLIGQPQELWWDELERLLLQPGRLPKELSLIIQGQHYVRKLDSFQEYHDVDNQKYRHWNVLMAGEPTLRHAMYREMYARLRPLLPAARQAILREFASQIGKDQNEQDNNRVMTAAELRQLSDGEMIDVGAHTMTHPVLSNIALSEQTVEIQQSKAYLETLLGKTVAHFSYPYGGRDDYTPETLDIVRQSGFISACSTLNDAVWPRTDRFQLPRLVVRNWSGAEFARQLAEWF